MDFKFNINVNEITDKFKDLKTQLEASVLESANTLALMTHAKVLELASEHLNSTAQTYKDAVSFEQIDSNMWVVSLDMKKAGFIEAGQKSGFMEYLLNGKSSKVSKSGKKYAVIPFHHNKAPSMQTQSARALTDQIKGEMKKRNIPYKELEKNADGSPRVGKLHSFNIESARPSKAASHPALYGLSIYQRADKMGVVKKEIMTFRVITEDHQGKKWMHPGSDGKKIFDEAFEWCVREWDQKILPEIYRKFNGG